MASITSTGIGSGLDVNAIITQLMAIEKQPLNQLQSAQTDLNTQLSAVGKLQSYTSALQDAAGKLTSITLWNTTTATSGDDSAVGVAVSSGAVAGSYAVGVQRLATGQTLTSGVFTNATTPIGAGTMKIELGSWTGNAAPDDFTAKSGSSPLTIELDDKATLTTVRDRINAAGMGVTAAIITDANGARLSLRSTATGAENAFRVTASETVDDGNAAAGLSALGYAGPAATSPMTRFQAAQNALATINGIPVESATNTLDGVADGVTLSLLKVTTADVAVTVTPDDDAVKSAVTDFTKAFNDLAGYIRDQTKYDAANKKAGALQGDRTALSLQAQLRGVINQESTASSVFARLSDIGITMKADGTLDTNSDKLASAIAKRAELRKAFATDGATTAASGFMDRFRDLAAAVLDDAGSLSTRTDSLNAMLKRNQASQDSMQTRLDATEARLRKQYQALDSNMARMSALSAYVSQQFSR